MIEDARLENVTLFREFTWEDLSTINAVIGANDTGKSNLLGMPYALSRSFQDFMRVVVARNDWPGGWKSLWHPQP